MELDEEGVDTTHTDISMNILTCNFKGVLNPCFRRALSELIAINGSTILILIETRLGGLLALRI